MAIEEHLECHAPKLEIPGMPKLYAYARPIAVTGVAARKYCAMFSYVTSVQVDPRAERKPPNKQGRGGIQDEVHSQSKVY